MTPHERYHLAAQAAVPLLSTWASTAGLDDQDAGRCRFQLDAPLIAGRPFFEMVAFMLKELTALEVKAEQDFDKFGPSQTRYKYVHDLFIAELLYYTNKFGIEELQEHRKTLFNWAYALRVELLRVQSVSVDNRARGNDGASPSAFILLRNAMTGRVVRQLNTPHKPYNDDHEKDLVAFISTPVKTP